MKSKAEGRILAAGVDVDRVPSSLRWCGLLHTGPESVLALHNERIRRRELRKVDSRRL